MTLAQFILACCLLLAPGRDHSRLVDALTARVDASPAIFRDDADKHKTAAELVAVAFREGRLWPEVVGDCDDHLPAYRLTDGTWRCRSGRPHSFCTFQVHDSSGGTMALTTDINACVAMGYTLLATSVRVCPSHPVAWYAEGPGGCTSRRAQGISRDRMALAAWLVRRVH